MLVVTALLPTLARSGVTVITIAGRGLVAGVKVAFGGSAVTDVTVACATATVGEPYCRFW